MQTYTLKMSGLTLEEAKELAENGSTFMWAKEGDDIVAYPSSHEHPAVISKEKEIWRATPPQEQGLYWHWSGSVDCAHLLSVLYSGSKKEYFVSIGQYGITKAIFCSEYGGFWASCPQPELPIGYGNDYDEKYIEALEKQVEILAHHLQIVCLDVEALPSHQEIYGNGAYEMIKRLEALWETKISADKVIGEHFEIMNGFKGD